MTNNNLEFNAEVPHIQVAASDTHRAVLSQILSDMRYTEPTCTLRAFEKSLIPKVLRTGTDRDKDSENWLTPNCDSTSAMQAKYGITSKDLIYAYRVTPEEIFTYEAAFSGNEEIYNALAVYKSSSLREVTTTEHWFTSDLRKALLAIITERGELQAPPTIGSYDMVEIASLANTNPIEMKRRVDQLLSSPEWNNNSGIVISGNSIHRKWKSDDENPLTIEYIPLEMGPVSMNGSMGRFPISFLLETDSLVSRKLETAIHNAVFEEVLEVVKRTRAGFLAAEIPTFPGAKEIHTRHFYKMVPNAKKHNVPPHFSNTVFILNTRQNQCDNIYRQLRSRGFRYVYGYRS